MQIQRLHDWIDGNLDDEAAPLYEVARQAAIALPRIFRPKVGDWVAFYDKPAEIVGLLANDEGFAIQVYQDLDARQYTVEVATNDELLPYYTLGVDMEC